MKGGKSFGKDSLAGQFLSYFLRLYLVIVAVGILVAGFEDAPQRLLLARANRAQLEAAWEGLLYQTDLSVAEHLQSQSLQQIVGEDHLLSQAAGVGNQAHPDLRRTFPWQGREYTYEFRPESLAARLQESLSVDGWGAVSLYDGASQPLTTDSPVGGATPHFSLQGNVRAKLAPLTATVWVTKSYPFAKVWSPWRLAFFVAAVILFPFVTARVFARRVTDPLHALEETSLQLAAGDLTARVHVPPTNEIGRLGATLNWMAGQLEERETQLQENNLRLQEINQLKSLFLASVSHELRTPLTAILGQTQMLLDELKGPISPDQRSTIEKTQRNASALLGLIDDLLDLGKIEAGRMDVVAEEFQLGECLHEALSAVEPQLKAKGLTLETAADTEVWALGDYSRTRQILINLLANAVKFTAQGTVSLRLEQKDARTVEVQVKDSGIGIPAELQEHIFDEFRQADSGVSRKFGGTGLGLSIARKLAELQGGKLKVVSQPGAGSTFVLTLPAAPPVP